MLAKRRLRSQMYSGAVWLLITVVFLSTASIMGSLKFRKLTKSFRGRAMELPYAVDVISAVNELQYELMLKRDLENLQQNGLYSALADITEPKFRSQVEKVETKLGDYRFQLENANFDAYRIGDIDNEIEIIGKCEGYLASINGLINSTDMNLRSASTLDDVQAYIEQLQSETLLLPMSLNSRMDAFSQSARAEYYSWVLMCTVVTVGALLLLYILYQQFRHRVFQPLEILVEGSRIVAAGNFDHRIELETDDEVAELAGALNAMTRNFQQIKQDLNQQVQQRTKEIVRSEKMASVGFLAAGVAHEINNPLSSIAWSAESLESRIHEILSPQQNISEQEQAAQIEDMKKYLQRIQEEAFRCKEITSALLDFSRMGETEKRHTNLSEIIQTVIDMVRPLSKYRERNIKFQGNQHLPAVVNAQEMKQVALNLITNALDNVADHGCVEITLAQKDSAHAQIIVSDDGCGMTDEVKQHLFEPFFTRRRDGQGTGLGLSITYQIIQEHGGDIVPYSAGPGQGSTFTVTLPMKKNPQLSRNEESYAA